MKLMEFGDCIYFGSLFGGFVLSDVVWFIMENVILWSRIWCLDFWV